MDDADRHPAIGEQEVKGLSILAIARNKRRLHRHFLLVLALSLLFALVIANFFGGKAIAGSVADVVTQVSNANFGSPEFQFGEESVTGYDFAIHAGEGEYGDGVCALSVLGPAQPDEIQIMVDYVDSISQITYMQTTQLKGCEVREYTADNGAGIGVILPDYFITVEIVDNSQSHSADLASAKSIAQQAIDSMEKAGLLSQDAPDIVQEEPQKDKDQEEDIIGETGITPGTHRSGHSHSPAGVGSVGNIPGPSNTTEAVTGVVVPGLIATALGALGGLGGGGSIPPAGGTPISPTSGGSQPGAGGTAETGPGASGMARVTNQFGRRGREEILVDATDMHHGSAIQDAPADQGIHIETEREAELFVQPKPLTSESESEIFIDTIDMHEQAIDIREAGGETGIHIDTTDMFEEKVLTPEIDKESTFQTWLSQISCRPGQIGLWRSLVRHSLCVLRTGISCRSAILLGNCLPGSIYITTWIILGKPPVDSSSSQKQQDQD
jgi:hypothetical protein